MAQPNTLIDGDPLSPSSTDLIAQVSTILVGDPVPEGWRVLTGNSTHSQIARRGAGCRSSDRSYKLLTTTQDMDEFRPVESNS